MNVNDKITLLTGETAWTTKANEELKIPSIKLTDGANGVRNGDIKATCFPSPVAVASSFDVEAVEKLGKAVAKECKYFGTNLLLAPSMNIKRSPLCGRNSGYYSEDPVLSGEIAAAFVNGVQSENVGACVKHFAVYNQETERMSCDCEVDEQTVHEIYLKGFEIAVKNSKPCSVMTSYNSSNGVYSSENKYYLTDILRHKWKFDGIVVSDWGGVNDRTKALKAGLDLEMPVSNYGIQKLKTAYENGELTEKEIDASVERIAKVSRKYANGKTDNLDIDYSKKIALETAVKSIVLLKNQDGILPLKNTDGKIAVIGEGAKNARVQSGGCDHTNLLWETDFITELKSELPSCNIIYEQGYSLNEATDENSKTNALNTVKNCNKVVFVLSLPEKYESEGYDRKDLSLPKNQVTLLRKIIKINPNTIVVMQNGSPVEMKDIAKAKGILETYLLGGVCGEATAKVLTGKYNPSGKLAETFPLKIEDTPCYLSFPSVNDKVRYSEGLFVGYRYYTSKKIKVAYPFGFGLSYTEFEISDVTIDKNILTPNEKIRISFNVKNTGKYEGAEVIQIYVGNGNFGNSRPIRELKKFIKIYLKQGESKTCDIILTEDDFTYYSSIQKDFVVKNGNYNIFVGTSCEDINAVFGITADGFKEKTVYDNHTRIGEIMKTEKGRKIVNEKLLGYVYMAMFGNFNTEIKLGDDITKEPFFVNVMNNMPLQALCNFSFGEFDDEKLQEVLNLLKD